MGPFLFAWADATETTFNESHHRFDEEVLSFVLNHIEGEFPALEISILNPRVGLLGPDRQIWAWLAYDRNWHAPAPEQVSESEEPESETPDIVPLFFGRLLGIPEDLTAEEVRLAFVARPEDYAEQKAEVAAALKVRPYWDGIWFSPETRDDPDNALEARPELWHIDRTTLQVSSSDILAGEDGVISLGEAEVFYDSLAVSIGQVPLRRVDVSAAVSWNQNAVGEVDLRQFLNYGAPHAIVTYTGDGLIANWPKPGTSLGGGWSVKRGSAVRVDGGANAVWGFGHGFGRAQNMHDLIVPDWAVEQTILNQAFPAHVFSVPRWTIAPELSITWDVSRKRSELATFSLIADVQAVLTETMEEETLRLSFASSEVAAPVDPVEDPSESESALALPIGDVRNRVYFSSARGTQSVEYLIAVARARLLARARTVSIDFEISFNAAVDLELSCRKSVVLTDARLPGGQAGGKIASYSLSADGDSGVMVGAITIGCSIGKGGTVAAVPGEPCYAASGYMNSGYQFFTGEFVMPIAGEVIYGSIEGLPANDDGVDFFKMTPERVVLDVEKTGDVGAQELAMGEDAKEPNDVFNRLNAVPTKFVFTLRPVTGGPFETLYAIPVSQLKVPKNIDLEAAA